MSAPGLDENVRALHRGLDRKIGPIEGLVIWAAGVPRYIAELLPEERVEFVVQGTGVLLAASMAFVSSFVAQGMLLAKNPPGTWARIFVSLLFAMLIFTVDRSLVRTSLRPHTFPEDVVNSLWDPYADARWYEVISGNLNRPSWFRRLREIAGVVVKVSIRLVLAGLISWVIADVFAIYVFYPSVKTAASQILVEERSAAKTFADDQLLSTNTMIANDYAAQLKSLQPKDIDNLKKNSDNASTALSNLNSDIGKMQTVVYAESNGQPGVKVTLSDGSVFPSDQGTSNLPYCAGRCQDDAQRLQEKRDQLPAVQAAYDGPDGAKTKYDKALAGVDTQAIDAARNQRLRDAQTQHDAAYATADGIDPDNPDLLALRAGLDRLVAQKEPWKGSSSPVLSCSASAGWVCSIKNAAFPNTPMGNFVSAFRGILFLIDILPILIKVYYSVKSRRPHDVLIAALEEASIADTLDRLDAEISKSARNLELRAAERRGGRAVSGARRVRQSRIAAARERRRIERDVFLSMRSQPGRKASTKSDSRWSIGKLKAVLSQDPPMGHEVEREAWRQQYWSDRIFDPETGKSVPFRGGSGRDGDEGAKG